jgi:probable F420-dependent oxidoreductase
MRIRFAVTPGPGMQEPEQLRPFVAALEALHFDTVWLSDVPVGALGDPLLGLTFAAGIATRLKLGTNVVPLGRNPYRLAKELAQLDRLSAGRLLLNFVPGIGSPLERETLGIAGVDRSRYLEQVIPLLRRWWAGETAGGRSTGLEVPEVALELLPRQRPLEIWLGGRGPRALERVGRFADGWLGGLTLPTEAGRARRAIEAAAEAAGREIDPDHFGVGITYARVAPAADELEGVRARLSPGADTADAVPVGRDALRRRIEALVAEGISKFVVRDLSAPRSSSADAVHEELAWLAAAVLPLQT